jgi:hypothetical protein
METAQESLELRIMKAAESAIVDFCLDKTLQSFKGYGSNKAKGLVSYGIVVDAIAAAIRKFSPEEPLFLQFRISQGSSSAAAEAEKNIHSLADALAKVYMEFAAKKMRIENIRKISFFLAGTYKAIGSKRLPEKSEQWKLHTVAWNPDFSALLKEYKDKGWDYRESLPHEIKLRNAVEAAVLGYSGSKSNGSITYGIVLDAIHESISLFSRNFEYSEHLWLYKHAQEEKRKDIILENNEWHEIESGSSSDELKQFESKIISLAARLQEQLPKFALKQNLNKELLAGSLHKIKRNYESLGCYSYNEDRFGCTSNTELDPYEIPWKPVFAESFEKLKEYGIKFIG